MTNEQLNRKLLISYFFCVSLYFTVTRIEWGEITIQYEWEDKVGLNSKEINVLDFVSTQSSFTLFQYEYKYGIQKYDWGRPDNGLYGKVSPRRGARYRWQERKCESC